ncbi:M23 family metallopeptidase [Streptomyces sp. Je 1-4]|uniref:M23 family metallopeptidase n=1 Tax=Streptomyces TaxID=1883 RepID=UPI0021D8E545|nr:MULTISPECIES: M23 family metallopeptidase [unclassified Streptomyces]UYB41939.1 M23 family metallopeptidase [Streptomyces sp. Je 1-4]UZQ38210.1 M23 family metallopeptidase [Streptomyces sp. Je 1-4] [Streptomyces sp. Je 1-4 4N24]UZQ45627.1 M23 family metallopeptidase [Streptomyces sp. Je 1-4] [Streptomyces sp. Je 1-4 4N24_ara]
MTTFRKSTPLRRMLLLAIAPTAMGCVLTLAASEVAVAASAGTWSHPTKARHRISSPYGVRGSWQAGHHTGIDLAVRPGTKVRSVGSGTVVLAKRSGAYGKAVTIRMNDGRYTLFGHLSRITVRPGQKVRARTRLGYSGATGRATGPHLHFEVRTSRRYGTDINPLTYLAKHGIRLTPHTSAAPRHRHRHKHHHRHHRHHH